MVFGVQVALSVAVATVLYVVASFFGEWLLAFLFYSYSFLVLLLALLNILTYRTWSSDPASESRHVFALGREIAKTSDKSLVTRLRERTASAINLVYTSILWPAVQLKGFLVGLKAKRLDLVYINANFKLDGLDVPCALFSLPIIIAVAAAHFTHGITSPYAKYILIACVGTIGLRHLEYIFIPGGLHQRLRQGRGDTQISFIVVTAADFLALVVAYVTLRLWDNGVPLSWDVVRSTVEALGGSIVAAKELWAHPERWRQVLAPSVDTACGLSGLLLTTALVKNAWEFKHFTRENQDYLVLAGSFATIGQFREGLRWANRAQVSPHQLIVKARLLMGLGDVPLAVQTLQSALVDLKKDGPDNLAMTSALITMTTPVPKASLSALLCELARIKASDAALGVILRDVLAFNKLSGAEALEALRPYRAEDYPLAFATIYYHIEREAEAHDLLAAAQPQREIDDIVRRTMLLYVGISVKASSDDEVRRIAEAWLAEHAATVDRLVGALKIDVEKALVLAQLVPPILIARIYGGGAQAFLEKLRNSLRADLGRNPDFEPVLKLEAKGLEAAAAAIKAKLKD